MIVWLALIGLCLGSFVNALVWRLYQQQNASSKKSTAYPLPPTYSITRGRSMCPRCKHKLTSLDLIPVFSWFYLKGKCRYCHKPISWQYPLVELITAALFVLSYAFWPPFTQSQPLVIFLLWLVFLVGFTALAVYDLRWQLLPDKITYWLIGLAAAQTIIQAIVFRGGLTVIVEAVYGVMVASGIFYILFQVSRGEWIGGGDVKLGIVLGLILGGPISSLLMLFLASLLGSIVSVPLILIGRSRRNSTIAFGPFLILATIILQLFEQSLIDAFKNYLIL